MSAEQLTEEQRAQRLRQRLWGATILIALAVIVLPLLLDGSGSESQFRRVESLRQEPTRVINADGTRHTVPSPEAAPSDASETRNEGFLQRLKRRFTENPPQEYDARAADGITASSSQPPLSQSSTEPPPPAQSANDAVNGSADATWLPNTQGGGTALDDPLGSESDTTVTDYRAWVVQAGSFSEEINALAVRDRLRRDGYPSFVSTSADGLVFRVRVGPMVNRQEAGAVQGRVMDLLGREAVVMPYP